MPRCFILPTLLALCATLPAAQTDNHGLHAVPPPGPVVIDGSLADWDLSGQTLMCYDLESLQDIYTAQVAVMYDAERLFVGIHWTDATPMGNSHDPRYQGNRGWAGDAVQLRIKTDRISHLTAWYYGVNKEPALQISYGKSLTEPFKGGEVQLFQTEGWKMQQGVEQAFKADADGKGYVQEIALPWKVITQAKIPTAGERIQIGFELLWGETDWPTHRYADNLSAGASSREFFWTAFNNWGDVTLEPQGHLHLPEPAWLAALRQGAGRKGGAGGDPVRATERGPRDAGHRRCRGPSRAQPGTRAAAARRGECGALGWPR